MIKDISVLYLFDHLFVFVLLSLYQASNPIDVAARPGAVPHTLLQKDPRVSTRPTVSGQSVLSVPFTESHTHVCQREENYHSLDIRTFYSLYLGCG